MIKILSHLFNLQFLKYLKVGVINTLCSLVIVYVLLFFEYDPYKSNLIGYIYGVFQSFFLNKAYAFSVEKLTSRHFASFILAFIFAYTSNLILLWVLIELLNLNIYFSQFLCMGIYAVVFFLTLKLRDFDGK
jgi:putative flippase GtrA